MKLTMEYQFTMTVGDWSRDGHNQSDVYNVQCNIPLEKLQKVYKKASKKIGLDICREVFSEYESYTLPDEDRKILEKFKIDPHNFMEKNDNGKFEMWGTQRFVDLIFAVCKLVDSTIEYKIVEETDKNNWNCGGYGLFWS